jgi:two-component system sensor histidine kinase CpxA
MNRLALRIFAALFAALVLIAIGAVLITGWVIAERRDARPGAALELIDAAREVAADGDRAALQEWLRGRDSRWFGRRVYIVDSEGRELLGRDLPLPPRLAQSRRWPVLLDRDGESYRLLLAPRRPPLLGVLSAPQAQLPLVLLTLLVVAAVSALLARSLTRPIADLQRAAQALAAGDLATRVSAATRARGDELGRLGAAFDSMARDLRELIDARERLLRDVSHELRSPLARMRLAIGLARRPDANLPAQLERLDAEIGRLDQLIGALLDVSRLEAGATSLRREPLDLAALMQGLLADARFEADGHGCSIVYDGPDVLAYEGDPHWLAAAVENVLRNALRHAPAGSAIDVRLASTDGQPCIAIRDRGPGVPETALNRIFEPFYRVDTPRAAGDNGTGLGLAIAARVVRAHGGSIEAANASPGLEVTLRLSGNR